MRAVAAAIAEDARENLAGVEHRPAARRKGNFICVDDKMLEIPSFILDGLADLEAERAEATVREFLASSTTCRARYCGYGTPRPAPDVSAASGRPKDGPVPIPDWRRGQHGQDRTE
jgi:hypothetical protein